LKYLGR